MAFPKGHIPWNKGIKRPEITGENNTRWKPKVVIECGYCKKHFETWPSKVKWGVKYCSCKCRALDQSKRGSAHHNWKGDNVGYRALHRWVEGRMGKPKGCAHCGQDNPEKRYHWANISKQYKRLTTDWVRLCTKCHGAYDRKPVVLP